MIYIYALADPATDEIRYVGKSIRPQSRLANHCNESSVTYRTNWIRTVLATGQRPKLIILEELPDEADWKEAERQWIAQGKEQGWRLTNCTSGGDGVNDLPPEIRARISAAWIGRKHRPESLVKIGAASRTRRHTDAWRETMRLKMENREFTPEWRARISQSLRKLTDEQVREIRLILANGGNQAVIAREFHVDKGTISNIKRKVCYADVV